MAIQNRRGVYSDFTPSKMVPGELAVVQSGDPNNTSGKAVYAAFGASGDVKRLASEDDLSGKVDKVTGKGLSTNDYTTAEKNKLSGIEAQANKTVIDSTLTQTGQAADAKAVGDAIDSVTIETDKTLTEEDVPADAKVVGDELASVKGDLQNKAPAIISSASGSIAHFEDGSESDAVDVVAHIEPVQDLHGYDSPWPAGGGKNLLDIKRANSTTNGITFTKQYDNSGNCIGVLANGTATSNAYFDFNVAGSEIQTTDLIDGQEYVFSGLPSTGSASTFRLRIGNSTGSSITYTNNVDGLTFEKTSEMVIFGVQIFSGYTANNLLIKPMIRLATETDPTFKPYSNICPISGFTGMNVTRTGKNLVSYLNDRTNNGIAFTYDQETGSYHVSGTASSGAWSDVGISASAVVNYPKLHAGTYIVSGFNDNVTGRVQAWYNDNTDETLITTVRESTTFTLTREAYVYLRAYVGADKTVDETLYPMIRFAYDTDDTFEPSHSTTYPITFPSEAGTVYGGYVDPVKGKLMVDRLFVTVDGNGVHPEIGASGVGITKGTQPNPNGTPYYITIGKSGNKAIYYPNINKVTTGTCAICDTYVSTPNNGGNAASLKANQFRFGNNTVDSNSKLFYFIRPETTVEDLLTSLSNNPFHFVYYLATPITYDITPTQIATLLGINNIWHDANGDTDVQYRADTKLFIEQLTKPTEDDMVADTNIASGKFFMIGNRLFISTAVIASGDTINPGTNCTELSLADALNSL